MLAALGEKSDMKKILTILAAWIGLFGNAASSEQKLPPVPKWQPEFAASIDAILERLVFYTNGQRDIVIFKNGTGVILPEGLSDHDASKYASEVLSQIFKYHPDMKPLNMNDGNVLVQYNHPACNIVISDFVKPHMSEIEARHLDGLATDEVIITPLGSNKFDEFGMKALYGRAFMFMDAQDPVIVKLYRHAFSGPI